MSRILVITGPTAWANPVSLWELARFFPLEIISADSMQVYRYMNIGTAKPTQEEMALVRHHLVDVRIRMNLGASRSSKRELKSHSGNPG